MYIYIYTHTRLHGLHLNISYSIIRLFLCAHTYKFAELCPCMDLVIRGYEDPEDEETEEAGATYEAGPRRRQGRQQVQYTGALLNGKNKALGDLLRHNFLGTIRG